MAGKSSSSSFGQKDIATMKHHQDLALRLKLKLAEVGEEPDDTRIEALLSDIDLARDRECVFGSTEEQCTDMLYHSIDCEFHDRTEDEDYLDFDCVTTVVLERLFQRLRKLVETVVETAAEAGERHRASGGGDDEVSVVVAFDLHARSSGLVVRDDLREAARRAFTARAEGHFGSDTVFEYIRELSDNGTPRVAAWLLGGGVDEFTVPKPRFRAVRLRSEA